MDFLRGKPIHVRARLRATGGNRISEWIITVARHHRLVAVHHVRHVSSAIRMIKVVSAPAPRGITRRPRQQSANPARPLESCAHSTAYRAIGLRTGFYAFLLLQQKARSREM